MAKKQITTKQPELADGEWGDNVPPPVQEAVDAYVAAMRKQANALTKRNKCLDDVKAIMRKENCLKVRVPDGEGNMTKMIELTTEDKVKIVKLKAPQSVSGEDDDDSSDDE